MTDSLIERMTEIAHRDSAVSVTVRADDLRALLSKLRAPVAGEPRDQQGVSVERLARDPFIAAQLWRKPVDRAPVADERAAFEEIAGLLSPNVNLLWNSESDSYRHKAVQAAWRLFSYTNALASAPVADITSADLLEVAVACAQKRELHDRLWKFDDLGLSIFISRIRGLQAALASAPVAGEATAWLSDAGLESLRRFGQASVVGSGARSDSSEFKHPLYAAPQASEAVRDAMRNLMWAASERDKGNRIRQFDQFMDEARAAISPDSAKQGSRDE